MYQVPNGDAYIFPCVTVCLFHEDTTQNLTLSVRAMRHFSDSMQF